MPNKQTRNLFENTQILKFFYLRSDQKQDFVDLQSTSWLRKMKENISTPINKVQCIAYVDIYLYFNWFISHKTDLFFFSSNKVEYEKEEGIIV